MASLTSVGAITLFVEDPVRSRAFYERVFEVAPIAQDDDAVTFRFSNVLVNLLRRSEGTTLVEPLAVAAAGAGSSFQLTVWVADADAACADLAARGVTLLNGPQDRPWGVRTAAFADPDGHSWEVAQDLSKPPAG